MELTRRHALAGAAALAASPLLTNAPARAAAPAAEKQAPSFYRYKVGDAQVTAISDGVNNFALPDTFVLNAKRTKSTRRSKRRSCRRTRCRSSSRRW